MNAVVVGFDVLSGRTSGNVRYTYASSANAIAGIAINPRTTVVMSVGSVGFSRTDD
jgi:hypothetical protein